MALPTSPTAGPPNPQQQTQHVGQTPGSVGSMGAAPTGLMTGQQAPPAPIEPKLAADIDPVRLLRVYGEHDPLLMLREKALKQAQETIDQGQTLQASQQDQTSSYEVNTDPTQLAHPASTDPRYGQPGGQPYPPMGVPVTPAPHK